MVCAIAPGAEAAAARHFAQLKEGAEPPSGALEAGAEVQLEGLHYKIEELLGNGSFGEVWSAVGSDGGRAAIKEIACRTEAELRTAEAEGEALQLAHAGGASAASAGKVPRLLASWADSPQQGAWRVRLAMTLLPGEPLERMLKTQRKTGARKGFLQACGFAGALLRQLRPVLEDLSARVYHRDVTTRNILVEEDRGGRPEHHRFTLVDFGLGVDAQQWQANSCGGTVSLAGDGRYWPSSAWLAFVRGTEELSRDPELHVEYQTRLDFHALGIAAMRCLMELWRAPQELKPGGALCDQLRGWGGDVAELLPRLRALWAAWKKYWSDSGRFWQPVYDVFRTCGDFDKLKGAYVAAGVHHIIRDDLRALHRALRDVRAGCRALDAPAMGGHAAQGCGPAELFDALLHLISPGAGGAEVQPVPAAAAAPQPFLPQVAQGFVAQGGPAQGEWLVGSPASQSTRSSYSQPGAFSTPNYGTPVSPLSGSTAASCSGTPSSSPFHLQGQALPSYAGSLQAACVAPAPVGWPSCAASAQAAPTMMCQQPALQHPAGVWVASAAAAPMVSDAMACMVLVPAPFPAF